MSETNGNDDNVVQFKLRPVTPQHRPNGPKHPPMFNIPPATK